MDASPLDARMQALSPDPALFWVWLGKATRPKVGWLLMGLGTLAIVLGYLGLSRRVLITEQMPYLISGGIGGMALIIVGGVFLATEDIRRDVDRVTTVETEVASLAAEVAVLREMVGDLHGALLRRADGVASADADAAVPAVAGNGAGTYALANGSTFHRGDCAMLEGKNRVSRVSEASIKRRQLEPCPLCAPAAPAP